MRIKLEQDAYNRVELTLSQEELDTVLDNIGEDQIEDITVKIKIPGAEK